METTAGWTEEVGEGGDHPTVELGWECGPDFEISLTSVFSRNLLRKYQSVCWRTGKCAEVIQL